MICFRRDARPLNDACQDFCLCARNTSIFSDADFSPHLRDMIIFILPSLYVIGRWWDATRHFGGTSILRRARGRHFTLDIASRFRRSCSLQGVATSAAGRFFREWPSLPRRRLAGACVDEPTIRFLDIRAQLRWSFSSPHCRRFLFGHAHSQLSWIFLTADYMVFVNSFSLSSIIDYFIILSASLIALISALS